MKSILSYYIVVFMMIMIWFSGCPEVKSDSVKESNTTLSEQQDISDANKTCSATTSRPIIIWYYSLHYGNPEILKIVLSNRIFTYVMLGGIHKDDIPDYSKRPIYRFHETMKICKEAGVKIVWNRWLWPGYKFSDFTEDAVFDPNYYAKQIRQIKHETKIIGADYSAFDCEPYGKSTLTPMRKRVLSKLEFEKMTKAVNTAINIEGQVDFVVPAAFPYPRHARSFIHFYRPLEKLGKLTIAAHTFYNSPSRINCENNVFDIFGAYCKKNPLRPNSPTAPFFSPREILERKDLWAHKKGVFIFPGGSKNSLELAVEFSIIKNFELADQNNPVEQQE